MTKVSPAEQRESGPHVLRRLRKAGYQALWAGGCVRDQLFGRTPNDYDVATSATPAEIRQVFGRRHTLEIGAAFGVVAVLGRKEAGMIEVTTFRRDAQYSDGRHPDAVVFSTPEEDAQRRDFTINGLFYDPLEDRVIDYVGGVADLERGLVRAIGDPRARFSEDKLRMIRAVRIAAGFNFAVDEADAGGDRRNGRHDQRRQPRTHRSGNAQDAGARPASRGRRIVAPFAPVASVVAGVARVDSSCGGD